MSRNSLMPMTRPDSTMALANGSAAAGSYRCNILEAAPYEIERCYGKYSHTGSAPV